MKKNNKKKGFTIVELVIVIAVIAILAAVLIPTFSNVIEKANESKALQAAKNAYTDYLAVGNNALETNHNLLIDTGDYILLVKANSLDTESVAKGNPTAVDLYEKATVDATTFAANETNYYTLSGTTYTQCKDNDTYSSSTDYYIKLSNVFEYNNNYYILVDGTFESCTIYTWHSAKNG